MNDAQRKVLTSVKEALELLEPPLKTVVTELNADVNGDLGEASEIDNIHQQLENIISNLEDYL